MSLLLIVIALVALMTLAVEGRVRFPVLNRVVIAVISPVNSCIQTFTGAASSLEKKLEAITTMEAENEQLKKENAELRRANIKSTCLNRNYCLPKLWGGIWAIYRML